MLLLEDRTTSKERNPSPKDLKQEVFKSLQVIPYKSASCVAWRHNSIVAAGDVGTYILFLLKMNSSNDRRLHPKRKNCVYPRMCANDGAATVETREVTR